MTISDLVGKIRHYTQIPRNQAVRSKNKSLWNQICSSMDAIEDAQLAIDSYVNQTFGQGTGEQYLAVYGLLQAIYVQQDAIKNLYKGLGLGNLDFADYPKLQQTRDIRNKAIGHPTNKSEKKGTSYHYISRVTMKYEEFQLISSTSGGCPSLS